MDEFLAFNPVFFPMAMGITRDTESYIRNMDSDTQDYVLRNINEDSTIYDIEQCISELRG